MDRSKVVASEWTKGSSRSGAGEDLLLGWSPDPKSAASLGDQVVEALRGVILGGRMRPGDALPATRRLAGNLGVSRGTVVEAYARLTDEGLVAGEGSRGTRVREMLASPSHLPASAAAPAEEAVAADVLPQRPVTTKDFELFRTARAELDLTPGTPDLGLFPRAAWLGAERRVLATMGNSSFGYGDAQGAAELREAVSRWLARFRGIEAAPERVIIVGGVAQALSLLARVLHTRGGRRVGVEDPGSLGACQQLAAWGLTTVPVPVDQHGVDVATLARSDVAAVMVTPAHQFPTGVALEPSRRRDLLAWATSSGGLVIEDDYDAEHRYDRHPVPALAASAPELVGYVGSVSKILAPALRVGWIVPPRDLVDDLVSAKRDSDLGNATLAQLVLSDLMSSGALEKHLRRTRRRHQERRDALSAALLSSLAECTILGASAGLHLTVALPAGVDDVEVARACLASGVKVQPLSWHRVEPGEPGLVLGYAASTPAALERAVERIAASVRAATTSPR